MPRKALTLIGCCSPSVPVKPSTFGLRNFSGNQIFFSGANQQGEADCQFNVGGCRFAVGHSLQQFSRHKVGKRFLCPTCKLGTGD